MTFLMAAVVAALQIPAGAVHITVDRPTRQIVSSVGSATYVAFPDICRVKNGDLLCVFYAGYLHVSPPNTQFPKGGRICAVRSSDDGKTWSEPALVADTPKDDRDPSVFCLPNGTVLCTFFTYGTHAEQDTYITRSRDSGKTWTEPEIILPGYATSTAIRRLRSGRLVLPVYMIDGTGGERKYAAVCLSDDGGETWSAPYPIGLDAGKRIDETDVYERKDGTLLAVARDGMFGCESHDSGEHWGPVSELGFPGHCPCLFMSRQGVLLLAHRFPNTALHYSTDEGRTWQGPIEIDHTSGAYPSMVGLRDGSILCVYYDEGPYRPHPVLRVAVIHVRIQR